MAAARQTHRAPHVPAVIPPEAWPVVDADLLHTLPPVLRAVIKSLGYARGREWLLEHGGVNVSIPARKACALGLEADELARLRVSLAPHMDASGRLWLPKADRLMRLTRDASIRREKHHQSINSQARQYRLSSRQITNIRREPDDRQGDLF